ncbi:MAG TPA: hypothetical protein VLG50_04895 [Candidatus Saccharimonadales bacterium]|nr:hypothetical protein [Candidatus Saccharimonadales bacterium]
MKKIVIIFFMVICFKNILTVPVPEFKRLFLCDEILDMLQFHAELNESRDFQDNLNLFKKYKSRRTNFPLENDRLADKLRTIDRMKKREIKNYFNGDNDNVSRVLQTAYLQRVRIKK